MSITIPCPGTVQLAPNVSLEIAAAGGGVMAQILETTLGWGEPVMFGPIYGSRKELAVISLLAFVGESEAEFSKAASLALQDIAKYAVERVIYSLYEDSQESPKQDLTTSRPGVSR